LERRDRDSTAVRAAAIIGAAVTLTPGLRGTVTHIVTDAMTAIALHSGDVAVLGTPAVLAMIEEAAVLALAGVLADGTTSVGSWVELEHLAPSHSGATIVATATLERVDDKRLEFTAEAHDGNTLIARAKHRRVIVDREHFG
jgi:fluoroacetyl-CoA thioesterase